MRARAEPKLKAATGLSELGLTRTHAIILCYRPIVRERGIPFPLRLPERPPRND